MNGVALNDFGGLGKFKLPKLFKTKKAKAPKVFKAIKAPAVPFVSARKKQAMQMAPQVYVSHIPHPLATTGLPTAANIGNHVKEVVTRQGFPRWIVRAILEGGVWVFEVNPAAISAMSEADLLARIAALGKMNSTEMMLVRVRMTRPMSQSDMWTSQKFMPGMGDLLLGRGLVGDVVFGAGIGLGLAVLLKKDAATWASYGAGIGAAKHFLASRKDGVLVLEEPKSAFAPPEVLTA